MSNFETIQRKLEAFVKKYYTNELLRGIILFLSIGLLYFLLTLLVEYFLWLNTLGRKILFWTFIAVELSLFVKLILIPLGKLLKLGKGIDDEQASLLIGKHFPEVSDKLLNVVQLHRTRQESELLAASIDQKAAELQPIRFQGAVNFKKSLGYLKYLAIPVLLFLLLSGFGGVDIFSSSYKRVVRYDMAFQPPAPFSFVVLNDNLHAIENQPFTLKVQTRGKAIPENASIVYNGDSYFMKKVSPGLYEYTFQQPSENTEFYLHANKIISPKYALDITNTPSLVNFEMVLDYPSYTGKVSEVMKSTGNATIPEGTRVKWQVSTRNTTEVSLKTADTSWNFTGENKNFELVRRIDRKLDYAITTSNSQLRDYENLAFTLNVVKDQYPDIRMDSKMDSTDLERVLFLGQVSDDYGLSKLQLVYYPRDAKEEAKIETLPLGKTNFHEFTYVFPQSLELEEGISYEYYFEVFDNDLLHNFKSTRSGIYSFRSLTRDEKENLQLQNQQKAIQGLDKSLEELKERKETLDELSRTQKEKKELNYNDRKKLENFIQRQKGQEEMMQNFSKQLREELEKFQPEREGVDPDKKQLEERLQENEERLKENEKLLEELQKMQEKIQKEELTEKLERLAKQNKNQEKNLEQLLELTKRYYVEKKAEKLAEELFKLGEKQEQLADKGEDENTREAQEKLNEAFEEYQKQMEELQKENDALKKPMDIPQDKTGEKEVEQEQKDATDKLQEQKPAEAGQKQKKAGAKMKEMSQQMQQQMKGGQMETLEEDVKMLRQILDNLIVFSFKQEDLMMDFRDISYGSPVYGKKLVVQSELKNNFEHIDDSLFALSLRVPMIGGTITGLLTETQYNIDKSMERLAQGMTRQGVGNQQYTVTGANDLAVLLNELLGNMQMQLQMSMGSGSGKGMPSPGSGGGEGFQLPDIIQKQESLNEKMKEGMEKGKKDGNEGSEGEKGKGEDGMGQGEGDGEGSEGNNGKDSEGGNREGEGGSERESLSGELFEIYKQQHQLRQELEERLRKSGVKGNTGNLLRQMEGIEQQLLERGFTESTLRQMQQLKYELLKLDEAALRQGEENRRESETSRKQFNPSQGITPEEIKKYFNTVEILNRDALPLRPDYQQKVKEYFKREND